jgi:hypothetical protein
MNMFDIGNFTENREMIRKHVRSIDRYNSKKSLYAEKRKEEREEESKQAAEYLRPKSPHLGGEDGKEM